MSRGDGRALQETPEVQYTGCDIPHVCEPVYCHVCEAHFMAFLLSLRSSSRGANG